MPSEKLWEDTGAFECRNTVSRTSQVPPRNVTEEKPHQASLTFFT